MAEPKPALSDRGLIEKQIADLAAMTDEKRRSALESLLADLRDGIIDYEQRAERNVGTEAGETYAAQLAGYRAALAHVETLISESPPERPPSG